ncbi:MAG TPA: hypothetical protein VJM13_06125, partial [Sphingopyxis sp.]|nr:hypothetical protein [Sphingopyxis sp.]
FGGMPVAPAGAVVISPKSVPDTARLPLGRAWAWRVATCGVLALVAGSAAVTRPDIGAAQAATIAAKLHEAVTVIGAELYDMAA